MGVRWRLAILQVMESGYRDRTMKIRFLVMVLFMTSLMSGCSQKQSQLSIHGGEFQRHLKLAEKGGADAQNKLGWMYARGQRISQDYKEAAKWFRRSSGQGHAHAQYNLGQIYSQGKGVSRDYKEAIKWFRLSAEKGNVDAQNKLGWMYVRGRVLKRIIKKQLSGLGSQQKKEVLMLKII